jgi:hypothetical protein
MGMDCYERLNPVCGFKSVSKFRALIGLVVLFVVYHATVNLASAQAGMTVSPGKLYYKLAPGASASQKLTVSNPNNRELEIVVSLSDWNYDSLGNNQTYNAGTLSTSNASWVKVMPGQYFTLEPNEKRDLGIVVTVPSNAKSAIPVHTSMLFLTQLNPWDAQSVNGALIKVSVRMGVKIYHSFSQTEERDIEVVNFTDIPWQ